MKTTFSRDLFVSDFASCGTWSVLPRQPTLSWDDTFCRIVYDTDDIHIDEIMRDCNRGDHDRLSVMADMLGRKKKPNEMTMDKVLNIVVAFRMLKAGTRLEQALNRMLWTGTEANRVKNGYYREFNGFDLLLNPGIDTEPDEIGYLLSDWLTTTSMEEIKFILIGHPGLLHYLGWEKMDAYEIDNESIQLLADHDVFCMADGDNVESSSLYIIPISEGDDLLTYIEHADYRHVVDPSIVDHGDFWSDKGLYVWHMQRERWDVKLSIRNESRLVIKQPELAMKINVKYPCSYDRDIDFEKFRSEGDFI